MKHINTRLRWLIAGAYLATAFFAWLENDKNKPTKEVKLLGDNEKASSFDEVVKYYKHKETQNV